ncbi:hypothetical protein QAD02_000352 [Eretmocerus hayati]|uniref:Uncharacterized protein n=1 Tax=Eretmocerus hayati TaxID=131215 RepID=A0ACC2NE90_9HYME|nr:hypothetical protein QAD02_000352 [Eretmocerus hayati]
MLERVNYRFLRTLASEGNFPLHRFKHNYSDVSSYFKVHTISSQHMVNDQVLMYGILRKELKVPELDQKIQNRDISYDLRNPIDVRNIKARSNWFQYSALNRCIKAWNSLPNNVQAIESKSGFRSVVKNRTLAYYV